MKTKTYLFTTKGNLEVKCRKLRFLLPADAKEGKQPIAVQYIKGSIPEGEAKWRLILPDGTEKSGERLAGNFFLPPYMNALHPDTTLRLEIDYEGDMEPPRLVGFSASQSFYYLPSMIAPALPPELEAMVKDPAQRKQMQRQIEMMQRPRSSEDIDPSRVEIMDKNVTIAQFEKRQEELGSPMNASLEVELSPTEYAPPSLILV